MKLGMAVGLSPGHIALDRDPASPPPKGHSPRFSAHIYCGQMAAWIQMLLGTEVGLGPGHIVLDGDLAHPQKRGHVCCGQTAGWIKMPLGTKVGLGPGHIVLDGAQLPTPKRRGAPNFRPMSIVAKRSPISATAEHLLYFVRVTDDTKCILVHGSACLSLTAFPHYCTDPDVTWGNGRGHPCCALLRRFAIGAQVLLLTTARTGTVSECLYSLYAWFSYSA